MTNDTKEIAVTAHGEAEYETVKCSSCENDVPRQDARRFVIGEETNRRKWGFSNELELKFKSNTVQEGWACRYCRNDGVVDYPHEDFPVKFAMALMFVFGVVMGVIVALGMP